jgi:hypothetical protein
VKVKLRVFVHLQQNSTLTREGGKAARNCGELLGGIDGQRRSLKTQV